MQQYAVDVALADFAQSAPALSVVLKWISLVS